MGNGIFDTLATQPAPSAVPPPSSNGNGVFDQIHQDAAQQAPPAQSWWQRFLASAGAPQDTTTKFPQRGDQIDANATLKNAMADQGTYMKQAYSKALPAAATAVAPEIAPEAGLLARAALTAGGAATGTAGGQVISGKNPIAAQQLKETGENAALAGASDLTLGGFSKLWGTKLARSAVNSSVGATARDVTYGNPAKGILDNNITTPITGDIEKYKDALAAGKAPAEAMQAAGGRAAAVSGKISQLTPQLESQLQASTAKIPVADAIDKPLNDAATQIMNNPAMTEAEKDAAVAQLGALQKSLKTGLGDTMTPLQANRIKQAVGQRVNWAGNIAVTDEVKPAYKAVYGSLKNAVSQAVPQSAAINDQLSDLYAAQTDIEKLMRAEEVGQGRGALGSNFSGIARRVEATAGRVVPAAKAANAGAQALVPSATVALNSLLNSGQQ